MFNNRKQWQDCFPRSSSLGSLLGICMHVEVGVIAFMSLIFSFLSLLLTCTYLKPLVLSLFLFLFSPIPLAGEE